MNHPWIPLVALCLALLGKPASAHQDPPVLDADRSLGVRLHLQERIQGQRALEPVGNLGIALCLSLNSQESKWTDGRSDSEGNWEGELPLPEDWALGEESRRLRVVVEIREQGFLSKRNWLPLRGPLDAGIQGKVKAERGTTVRGYLLLPDGSPVPKDRSCDVRVTRIPEAGQVEPADRRSSRRTRRTYRGRLTADGFFQIDVKEEGRYELQASVPKAGSDAVPEIEIRHAEPVDPPTLVLGGRGFVVGRIEDPTGQPVIGVLVNAKAKEEGDSSAKGLTAGSARTNAMGRFQLEGMRPGRYKIWVDNENSPMSDFVLDQRLASVEQPGEGRRYTLNYPTLVVRLSGSSAKLHPAHANTGRLPNDLANLILVGGNWILHSLYQDPADWHKLGTSYGRRRFLRWYGIGPDELQAHPVPGRDYTLSYIGDGIRPQLLQVNLGPTDYRRVIELDGSQRVENATLELRIVDADGSPWNERHQLSFTPNGHDHALLDKRMWRVDSPLPWTLPPGSYRVRIHPEYSRRAATTTERVIALGPGEHRVETFALQAGGYLRLQVDEPSGGPGKAFVELACETMDGMRIEPEFRYEGFQVMTGIFYVPWLALNQRKLSRDPLPAGTYTAKIHVKGFPVHQTRFEILRNETTRVDVTLER